jgi:hypothetical protein
MSVYSPQSVTHDVPRATRLLQRLRALRSDADNPYSPVASLALLLIVGVAVKFIH